MGKRKKVVRRRRKARKPVRGSKGQVFRGTRSKTNGSLTKDDLKRNKRGKVVSKKASALGKKRYKNVRKWTESFMQARKNLKIKGFVPCKKGTALYRESMKLYKA